jgi:hypothetical protein
VENGHDSLLYSPLSIIASHSEPVRRPKAGFEQEGLQSFRLALKDFLDQIVGDITLASGEGLDEFLNSARSPTF